MSAEDDLWNACGEWRRLAEAEENFINGRDWPRLAGCQAALAQLQPRITGLLREVRTQWRQAGEDVSSKERRLRDIFADLIRLEQGNASLLTRLRAASAEKIQQLGQAARNLKRIQHSYSTARGSEWCSFS